MGKRKTGLGGEWERFSGWEKCGGPWEALKFLSTLDGICARLVVASRKRSGEERLR